LLVLLTATSAFAQSLPTFGGPSMTRASEQASRTRRAASVPDGMAITSAGGDYRVQLGLLVHEDSRLAWNDDQKNVTDTFVLRRFRPSVRGRVAHRFDFFVNPDFSNTTTSVVQDLYIDTVFNPAFRLRVGKGKTPFGLERLQSALNLTFLERGMPTAVAPNRDIGVQALGDLRGDVFSYLVGVMNGVGDGGSYSRRTGDGKEISGRFVVRPFNVHATHPLHGLALAISGSTGDQTGTPLRFFQTQTLRQRYFSYANGVTNDGRRERYSPQVSFYHGRFGGFGEYVRSQAPVRRAAVREDIAHQAWQVAGSWLITGETATDAQTGVRPHARFDPAAHHWGALQVAFRYQALKVDDEAIALGFASADSSHIASGWTAGVNWYLNDNLRCTSNFERTVFDHGAGARPAENVLAFRTQLIF